MCTCITYKNGDFYFGRNMDLEYSFGECVVITPRAFPFQFKCVCFLQALFPQKCRLNSSKLHGEFPHYCISSAGTLSGAGEEPLQAYKVY